MLCPLLCLLRIFLARDVEGCPPAETFRYSSSPWFKTKRWVIEWTLCHTTSCPLGMLLGFGEKDCAPLIATTLMTVAFDAPRS
jgi:hypothetical protein